jgi:amidase
LIDGACFGRLSQKLFQGFAMLDLPFKSATQLVADIKAKRVGARELLELYLARLDRFNPEINAVIQEDREGARKQADLADQALASSANAGQDLGPLHGLPMTVKESFNIAGMPTTWGMPIMRGNIATEDAHCVQKFKQAGAVVFGKTNVPIQLGDLQSYNDIYGTTNNPWNLKRTPGGSSGGAAAALAAGLTGLEMGSDIGGSIRNPAYFCGVFGHKSSFNLVPTRGHELVAHLTPTDIAVVGPLARSAHDLELALKLVCEPDELDQAGQHITLQPLGKPLNALRVALWHSDSFCPVSQDVQIKLNQVGESLIQAGAHVSNSARPHFKSSDSHGIFYALLMAALGSRIPEPLFKPMIARANQLSPTEHGVPAQILRAQTMRVNEWTRLNEARASLRRAWHEFFKDYDFLIAPIMPSSAFVHDHSGFEERRIMIDGIWHPYFNQTFWAGLAGVALLPATVIPTGVDSAGLPIGVQIIGPNYGDLKTIQLAQALEARGFAFQAPKTFDA